MFFFYSALQIDPINNQVAEARKSQLNVKFSFVNVWMGAPGLYSLIKGQVLYKVFYNCQSCSIIGYSVSLYANFKW